MSTQEKPTAVKFYSVADLQQLLGIGRNAAYKLVRSKGFPAISVGNRIIIPMALFDVWVAERASR